MLLAGGIVGWALFTSERSHPRARSEAAKKEACAGVKGVLARTNATPASNPYMFFDP